MEEISDRTKGLLENKKICKVGFAPINSRLLSLKRFNEVLQVLTGHCNLHKQRKTIEHDVSSTSPKCNLEEETPNRHVGECNHYQDLRKKVFGIGTEITTIKSVVKN